MGYVESLPTNYLFCNVLVLWRLFDFDLLFFNVWYGSWLFLFLLNNLHNGQVLFKMNNLGTVFAIQKPVLKSLAFLQYIVLYIPCVFLLFGAGPPWIRRPNCGVLLPIVNLSQTSNLKNTWAESNSCCHSQPFGAVTQTLPVTRWSVRAQWIIKNVLSIVFFLFLYTLSVFTIG